MTTLDLMLNIVRSKSAATVNIPKFTGSQRCHAGLQYTYYLIISMSHAHPPLNNGFNNFIDIPSTR